MKKTLLTFGDKNFAATRERLKREARASGLFDEVLALGPENLDAEFLEKHGRFMRLNPRGYGYWIWKPHLISEALAQAAEGDFVIYADAGSSIAPQHAARLDDYLAMIAQHPSGMLAFEVTHTNRPYTKMDLFEAMKASQFMDSLSKFAGIVLFRKCPASVAFVEEWARWSSDYHLVSNSPSRLPNDAAFIEHRHDQSIFSILCAQRNVLTIPDETFGESARSPIVAARLKPRLGFWTKLRRSILKRRAEIGWRFRK